MLYLFFYTSFNFLVNFRVIMSFGIIRITKYTSVRVRGIEIHDKKLIKKCMKTDITPTKNKLHYTLYTKNISYQKQIKERLNQLTLKKTIRKDAIVLAQCMVTSDLSFFLNCDDNQRKNFFKDSFEFIKEVYNYKNIISATVHLDEKTPHMHVNFIPITSDNRLSAKSLLNRQHLRNLHDMFYKKVGKKYNLERGIKGGTTKHIELLSFKQKALKEEIKKLIDVKNNLFKDIQQEDHHLLVNKIKPLFEETNKSQIQKIVLPFENTTVLSERDFRVLKQFACSFYIERKDKERLAKENNELQKKIEHLQSTNHSLFKRNEVIKKEKMKVDELFKAKSSQVEQLVLAITEIVKNCPNAYKIVLKHTKIIEINKKEIFLGIKNIEYLQ